MKCQLLDKITRVLVLAFFLCKFNVLSSDVLMTSPLCWHQRLYNCYYYYLAEWVLSPLCK